MSFNVSQPTRVPKPQATSRAEVLDDDRAAGGALRIVGAQLDLYALKRSNVINDGSTPDAAIIKNTGQVARYRVPVWGRRDTGATCDLVIKVLGIKKTNPLGNTGDSFEITVTSSAGSIAEIFGPGGTTGDTADEGDWYTFGDVLPAPDDSEYVDIEVEITSIEPDVTAQVIVSVAAWWLDLAECSEGEYTIGFAPLDTEHAQGERPYTTDLLETSSENAAALYEARTGPILTCATPLGTDWTVTVLGNPIVGVAHDARVPEGVSEARFWVRAAETPDETGSITITSLTDEVTIALTSTSETWYGPFDLDVTASQAERFGFVVTDGTIYSVCGWWRAATYA